MWGFYCSNQLYHLQGCCHQRLCNPNFIHPGQQVNMGLLHSNEVPEKPSLISPSCEEIWWPPTQALALKKSLMGTTIYESSIVSQTSGEIVPYSVAGYNSIRV